VTVADEGTAASAATQSLDRMEIVLVGGERIIVGADVEASCLARVVKHCRGDDPNPGGRSGVAGDGPHMWTLLRTLFVFDVFRFTL
jgi:hypothetical protein